MHLVFSDQPLPARQVKSIFLAGPSPRRADEPDWRPQALKHLQERGFDGTVFLPIPKHRFHHEGSSADALAQQFANSPAWSYDDQVAWECDARAMADLIVFWVPRRLDRAHEDLGMPAFTTNFELGEDLHSGKVLYGRPHGAPKCSYLDQRAKACGLEVFEDLAALLKAAVRTLGPGAAREGGEAQVPLRIWNTPAFQSWYTNLKAAGNRLEGAKVLSQVTVGSGVLFSFVLKANVWVAREGRNKTNEILVSRPDTSSVVAAHRSVDAQGKPRIELALVREFRTPVNNVAGWVIEPPAGSAAKPGMAPALNAREELHEETGLLVEDLSRFLHVSTRQLAATFSTHRSDVYAIELTADEFAQLRAQSASGQAKGDAADVPGSTGERTYVVVCSLQDVFSLPVDYSTIGMLVEGLRALGFFEEAIPRA